MTTAVIAEDTEAMPEQPRAEVPNPRWAQGGLVALLVATAVFYLWGLSASGYANSFYSAAVQAGSVSWKAFFYGSSDAANSITVDKPPASLWVMALSVRVFGLNWRAWRRWRCSTPWSAVVSVRPPG
jgi:4-amino-4-deoxy-L-arabinose transferase-like glycosyltransferase